MSCGVEEIAFREEGRRGSAALKAPRCDRSAMSGFSLRVGATGPKGPGSGTADAALKGRSSAAKATLSFRR